MSSPVNAQNAAIGSTPEHCFPWKWWMKDYPEKNGYNVFSCFSCGGGSTMGYKLAGYTVLGNCEIDPRMMAVYKHNHHPKYSFLADIRDFAKLPDEEIPEELFHLDILDGSPPCSVFSMAGDREAAWGKKKVFREGQKAQTLDDLFDEYLKVVKRLQPKVVVAENVKGLILGKAKPYVNHIFKLFSDAGYNAQLFLLNSEHMGVPQARERTFFVARRKDLPFPKLSLSFTEPVITFGEVRTPEGAPFREADSKMLYLLKKAKPTDTSIGDVNERMHGKWSMFSAKILHDNRPAFTLTAAGSMLRYFDKTYLSPDDYRNIQTFPQDYDFGVEQPQYVCGMSVPPVMMAQLAAQIKEQWLDREDELRHGC